MDCLSVYHCPECCRNFKEFVIFEGHLTFNRNCRLIFDRYMQCYVCQKTFRNLASLKYHLQTHTNHIDDLEDGTHGKSNDFKCFESSKGNCPAAAATTPSSIHQINEKCGYTTSEGNGVNYAKTVGYHTQHNVSSTYASREKQGFPTMSNLTEHSAIHSAAISASKNRINRNYSLQSSAQKEIVDAEMLQVNDTTEIEINVEPVTSPSICLNFSMKGRMIKGHAHRCKLCKANFAQICNLHRHMKVHARGTLACSICKVTFTKIGLHYHQKSQHPEVSHSIEIVKKINRDRKSNSRSSLNVSLRGKKIEGSAHRCKLCGGNFANIHNLSRHMKVHLRGTMVCDICEVNFTPITLAQHRCIQHSKAKIYKCTACELLFRQKMALQLHMEMEHNKRRTDRCSVVIAPVRIFECYVCNALSLTFDELNRHIRKHSIIPQKPLVLTENLNANRIDLQSSDDELYSTKLIQYLPENSNLIYPKTEPITGSTVDESNSSNFVVPIHSEVKLENIAFGWDELEDQNSVNEEQTAMDHLQSGVDNDEIVIKYEQIPLDYHQNPLSVDQYDVHLSNELEDHLSIRSYHLGLDRASFAIIEKSATGTRGKAK